jgi:outer membrane protein assembly factor BamB
MSLTLLCGAQELQQQLQVEQVQVQQIAGGAGKGEGKLMELNLPDPKPLDLKNGRSGWTVSIPGGRPLATPAVVDGLLFIGGGFGSYEFYALNASTGKRVWTFKCGDDGPTAAVADEGCVAYNTESCTIYIQDTRTGKVLWHKWLGDPLMSQPAIGAGKVFMAFPGKGGHHLAAFGLKTGKVAWDRKISAEVITAPVVAGDFLVAATVDGTVWCFDLVSGKKIWSEQCRATSAPRVVGNRIFISQRSEKTIEIEDEKGKKKSSKITVEGLNFLAMKDGKVEHEQPLSPVKASFLLTRAGQGMAWNLNNAVQMTGQHSYRHSFGKAVTYLENRAGAKGLVKDIGALNSKKVTDKPKEGIKDAEKANDLADRIEKEAAKKPANAEEEKQNRQLRELAMVIRNKVGKTMEAAGAAVQAGETLKASESEEKAAKKLDASVGFAEAPAAAQMDKAANNIGGGTVKAVWAYQGSRPCLYKGLSIMVHGPRMRALDAKTGKVAWEHRFDFKADATRPITPPALAGDMIYVGTADGRIICLRASDGKQQWQEKVGGRILFEPAVVKGNVYAATEDGKLICLKTGDKKADGWAMWGGSAKHNGPEK